MIKIPWRFFLKGIYKNTPYSCCLVAELMIAELMIAELMIADFFSRGGQFFMKQFKKSVFRPKFK